MAMRSISRLRRDLYSAQGRRCGSCSRPIPLSASLARHASGHAAWLCCRSCQVLGPVTAAAVAQAKGLGAPPPAFSPLLAARLLSARNVPLMPVTAADLTALAARNWAHFPSVRQMLWTAQGGGCALTAFASEHSDTIVLDHAHDHTNWFPGLVRGFLCGYCNSLEGKSNKYWLFDGTLAAYRTNPPAQQFRVTRGLTYRYLALGHL